MYENHRVFYDYVCHIFLLFYFALINYFRSEFVDLYGNVSGECWFDVDIECINI